MTFTPIKPDKWTDCNWCCGGATHKGSDGYLYCDNCRSLNLNQQQRLAETMALCTCGKLKAEHYSLGGSGKLFCFPRLESREFIKREIA